MDLFSVIIALRALTSLTDLRRRELIRRASFADPADLAGMLASAQRENEATRLREETELEAEFAAIDAEHRRRAAPAPAQRPQQRTGSTYLSRERYEPPRPVMITYTTPTKPLAVLERGEGINARGTDQQIAAKWKQPREYRVVEGVEHGIRSYKNPRIMCRCDVCRAAKAATREATGKRRPNGEEAPHGTTTSYRRGCRCSDCRGAMAQLARKYRAQKSAESL